MSDMRIVLGGQTLPKYMNLNVLHAPRKTRVETLGASIYTDYVNNRRIWEISWKNMLKTDYDIVKQIYLNQFLTGQYPIFQLDSENIYAPVELEISDADLKYNGVIVPSFTLVLNEKHAIS